jgi:hypothetical protein
MKQLFLLGILPLAVSACPHHPRHLPLPDKP